MKNITALIFIVVTILNSCETNNKTEKRKELIDKFLYSVRKYDTITIYKIIDTTSYFNLQDKESLLDLVNYVNNRLKVCGFSIPDRDLKVKEVPVFSKEYTVPFCRGKNGEIVYDSFDLLFTFTDYETDEIIHYVDIIKYRGSPKPTVPVPTQ